MKKIMAWLLILILALTWNGCSSEPSALDQLKEKYAHPLDVMRLPLPDKPSQEKEKTPRPDQPQALEAQE